MNEKRLNEGNKIHNFISSSGSGTVINYRFGSGSSSTSQNVTVPTVPVPVPVPLVKKLRFRFRFHNAGCKSFCWLLYRLICSDTSLTLTNWRASWRATAAAATRRGRRAGPSPLQRPSSGRHRTSRSSLQSPRPERRWTGKGTIFCLRFYMEKFFLVSWVT